MARVLRGEFLTTGPTVQAFEDRLADVSGTRHAISCSIGTAALHLAMIAAGMGPGDKAVVPAITFLATANAVRYVGADVVFCDVDPETGLMGPKDLQCALDQHGADIKAVLPVHMAGQSPDLKGIADIARHNNLSIVEDASHGLGSTHPGGDGTVSTGCCHYSDMSVFSFHPVKTIAMGEGGAITTNDNRLAVKLKDFRNHGMTREASRFVNTDMAFSADGAANPWYYEMHEPGFNYRASDIHCALGLSQLDKLEGFVKTRSALVAHYDKMIEPLSPAIRPLGRTPGCRSGWHLYVVLIDFEAIGIERSDVMRRLKDRGIGSQVHYIPVHRQPYYRERYGQINLPGADDYYARCLTLPLHPSMDEADVKRVVNALGDIVTT